MPSFGVSDLTRQVENAVPTAITEATTVIFGGGEGEGEGEEQIDEESVDQLAGEQIFPQ
jgi:hypothetical protein